MSYNSYIILILSLIALGLGPIMYHIFTLNRKTLNIFDKIIFLIVGSLVLFHLIPHNVEEIGWVSIVLLFFGVSFPAIIEKYKKNLHKKTHQTTIVIIGLGLLIHALLDGMALMMINLNSNLKNLGLPLAIILHRLPAGLTIWLLSIPIYGYYKTIIFLLIMCIITVFGFFLNDILIKLIDHSFVAGIQSIVSGSLLHVLFHKTHHPNKK